MSDLCDLQYSPDASVTRYYYFKDNQDVNIFVEDQNKEFEYEEIFSKLLPGLKINSIFATGGKSALKKAFDEFGKYDKQNPDHANIFIADGDFDILIRPHEMITDEHFIYLDAYNIEDYLFDETACIKYAVGKLHKPLSFVRSRINFCEWYSKIISQSKKLFLTYCYIQSVRPDVPNVSNSPYVFLNANTGFERAGAFKQYKDSLLTEYKINIDSAKDDIDSIEKRYISIYGDDFWHLICGKFMLKSLMNYLISKGVKSIKEDDLKWWLISNISLKRFSKISSLVTKIIENQKGKAS